MEASWEINQSNQSLTHRSLTRRRGTSQRFSVHCCGRLFPCCLLNKVVFQLTGLENTEWTDTHLRIISHPAVTRVETYEDLFTSLFLYILFRSPYQLSEYHPVVFQWRRLRKVTWVSVATLNHICIRRHEILQEKKDFILLFQYWQAKGESGLHASTLLSVFCSTFSPHCVIDSRYGWNAEYALYSSPSSLFVSFVSSFSFVPFFLFFPLLKLNTWVAFSPAYCQWAKQTNMFLMSISSF